MGGQRCTSKSLCFLAKSLGSIEMKLLLYILLFSGLVYSDRSIDGLYTDDCGNSLMIMDDEYYFELGSSWSKGKVVRNNQEVLLTGITVYDTVVKHVLPDGTDSLFNKKDFYTIVSLDSISNRTQRRDISQILCCEGQLDSFEFRLEIESTKVWVKTELLNGKCDTLKMKEN
jgi:hypothetical protein